MEITIDTLKDKAKRILGNVSFGIFLNEDEILKSLQRIIDENIFDDEINLFSRNLKNIEEYLSIKTKFVLAKQDHEYLITLAESLRNQKVRIDDEVPFSSPIFTILIDENDKEKNFSFITREGAARYIEYNKSLLKHLPIKDEKIEYSEGSDRRQNDYIHVEGNRNLEIERIIEIIKRNF